nr:MAG TPA: hypothetical protein [Caudoviricetes sp.]
MANRFTPIPSNASLQQALQLINRDLMALDNEATTKNYKQAGGNAVTMGRLPNKKYGISLSDTGNKQRILLGQHPKDGHIGLWISKEGIDVMDELNHG